MTTVLQHWVSEQADTRPERAAVVSGAVTLTYGDLERLSNQIARLLRAGCERGDRVALLMPKSPMAIAALVGIYKADCIYVPLDPSSPARRLQKVLDSCESRWLLAAGPTASRLQELFAAEDRGRRTSLGWLDAAPPPADSCRPEFTLADVFSSSAD